MSLVFTVAPHVSQAHVLLWSHFVLPTPPLPSQCHLQHVRAKRCHFLRLTEAPLCFLSVASFRSHCQGRRCGVLNSFSPICMDGCLCSHRHKKWMNNNSSHLSSPRVYSSLTLPSTYAAIFLVLLFKLFAFYFYSFLFFCNECLKYGGMGYGVPVAFYVLSILYLHWQLSVSFIALMTNWNISLSAI